MSTTTIDEPAFSVKAVSALARRIAYEDDCLLITTLHLLEALASVPGTEAYDELDQKGCRDKIISEARKQATLTRSEVARGKVSVLLKNDEVKKIDDAMKRGEFESDEDITYKSRRESRLRSIQSTANVDSALEAKWGSMENPLVEKAPLSTGRVLHNLRMNRSSAAGNLLRKLEPSWKMTRASKKVFTSDKKAFHAAASDLANAVTSAATTFLDATVGNVVGEAGSVPAIAQSIGDFTQTFVQEEAKAQDGFVSYRECSSDDGNDNVLVIAALTKTAKKNPSRMGINKKSVLELIMTLSVMVPQNTTAGDVCQGMVDEYGNKVADYLQSQISRFVDALDEQVACIDA